MAHGKYWHTMTKEQQKSCKKLYEREQPRVGSNTLRIGRNRESYLKFRRRFKFGMSYDPYFIGPWCGMFIGIEPDGHTHS